MRRLPTPTRARALLGVAPDATPAEIRAAFRSTVRRDRPDLDGLSGAATVELVGARDILLAMAEDDAPRASGYAAPRAPAPRTTSGRRHRIVRPADEVAWLLWRPATI
ncbi:MAG: hypothetical protein S0880_23480 [Actinomycetota bacterium]|nr:hypothetical protein [Actinomycetota bacterium]